MFDPSAPHIIILLVVVLLLFGSRRLPGAARSLGESMHIFKKSVRGSDKDDEDGTPAQGTTVTMQQAALPPMSPPQVAGQPQAQGAPTQEQQMADLQRQINDLQKQNVGADGQPSD
jgi:sec-independent protein translocase protein TatA